MMPESVLAKSPVRGQQISLAEHVTTVSNAAQHLFGSRSQPTRLGTEWLRFFGLTLDQFHEFSTNLYLAALFHDLGKANDGFQATLRHRGQQAIRHEHLSALLLYLEPIRDWLCRGGTAGIDFETVLSAVVSHHLKVNDQEFGKRLLPGVDTFNVFTQDADFVKCLRLAEPIVGTAPPDLSAYDRLWSFEHDVDPRKGPSGDLGRSMNNFKLKLQKGSERHRLLVAVKAGLIAADSAGSAVVREGYSLEKWIGDCFEFDPLTADWVEKKIIRQRISEIERKTHRAFQWHDFQIAAGELGNRALLLSGCGTGKTLAAWRWIKSQLSQRPVSRVIFLYPTRSTATEGFRDYVSWAGGEDATLLHGTAAYDLAGIFQNPGDPRHGGDYHVQERLFALGYWPKRVFSATVDSFLAFMRNQYASLCLLPVLADSVVVVDEVHSFDRSMFTALDRFLKFFNLPVLCMTASLPTDRLEILRDGCGLEVFPHTIESFEDLKRQSEIKRYKVSVVKESRILKIVKDAIVENKKVLWVVNTVARCQQRARDIKAHLSDSATIFCYHSRFKLRDRRAHHNQVIQEFDRGTVVVSTQVCEMSLDIDADVLVTEIAPVPSLIQRMGRCCREPLPSHGRIGNVYVYFPVDSKPYEKAEIAEGRAFVEAFSSARKRLSHADLGNYLASMQVQDPFIEGGYIGFLDVGPYAMARDESFRDADDFTVDCVLDSEIDEYLVKCRARDPEADGYVVPVPKRFALENTRLGRYIREASATQYHSEFGFLDEETALWLKR
jgi:CRISPR-associated endonuclease/helicase Cas3